MSSVPSVFISATSRDLGSYRVAVADTLREIEALGVIQDDFPPGHLPVREVIAKRIAKCDAVICLIGRRHGREPSHREDDEPRRSYTQLEYEIAAGMKNPDGKRKPLFVFLAKDDCPLDNPDEEPESPELQALQRGHRERVSASDQVRMTFRSLDDLLDQVRVMRFDPDSLARGIITRLAVVMTVVLADIHEIGVQQGVGAWARDVVKPYHEILRAVLDRWEGKLQSESSTDCQVNFESADAAVNAALDLHESARRRDWPGSVGMPGLRVGIHVGQIVRFGGMDASHVLQTSPAMAVCKRLAELALDGQTLLTRQAFEIARGHIRHAPTSPSGTPEGEVTELLWIAHGRYRRPDQSGDADDLEIHEVGVPGRSPLVAPPDTHLARRAGLPEVAEVWHPAEGREIPRRPGWVIERKLGEGGFGEVWVAFDRQLRDRRVYKFCSDSARLSSFNRELTLSKYLRETLGNRADLTRFLGLQLDEAPYFLESEFISGGNLREWAKGHLAGLRLEDRLRLLADIARAVAAAHSVGVIHRDLKPSNILMREEFGGPWRPMLADFGIGRVSDLARLESLNIEPKGFTGADDDSGSRMYQSPESGAGSPPTMRDDVFALGVLLYQLLLGDCDVPFGEGFEDDLESAWAKMGLDPSRDTRFRLLRADIGACVVKDPARRLATAAQVVERIETLGKRVVDEEAEETRLRLEREALKAQEFAGSVARRNRRLRLALAGALMVLAGVAGLGLFARQQWLRAEQLQKSADDARQKAEQSAGQARASAADAIREKKEADVARGEADVARGVALRNEKKAEESAKLALANADAASQQSRLALETLGAVIFDIQRSVRDFPTGSEIRRRLLMTALNRLEGLSGEFVEKSSLDRNTAVAMQEMGLLVLQFGESSDPAKGDPAGRSDSPMVASAVGSAYRFFSKGHEIFSALVQKNPNDAVALRDLGVSCNRLGDVLLRSGDEVKALAMYQRSLELDETRSKANPADAQARRDLAVSCTKLGDVFLQTGEAAKALALFQRAFDLQEARAKDDPANDQARRDLGVACNRLGDALLQTGDVNRALALFQRSLEMDESRAKANPADAEARRDLAISRTKLGDALMRSGEAAKALAMFQRAFDLQEARAKEDTADFEARRDLGVACNRLGDALLQTGDVAKALAMYQRSLEMDESRAKADLGDAEARRDLAISYNRLGDALLRSGDMARALALFQRAFDLHEAKAKANPADAKARRDLGVSCNRLGDALLRSGDVAKALAMYQRSLELDEARVKADPADAEARRDLAISCNRLGDALLRAGEAARSQAMFQRAFDLHEARAKANPTDVEARRDLAISCNRLGDALLRAGDAARALTLFQRAFDLHEARAKADPADAESRRDLGVACTKLGDALLQSGDAAKALTLFERSLELDDARVKADPADAEARRDLAISCHRLGDALLRSGDAAKALALYQRAFDLIESRAKASPTDDQARRELAISCRKLGQASERLGDFVQALIYYRSVSNSDKETVRLSPRSADARRLLAVDCEKLSALHVRLRNWAEAVDQANQAIENAREAHRIEGDAVADPWDYSIEWESIAVAQIGLGQLKEARASFEEAGRADPKWAQPRGKLAWLLATSRDDSIRDGRRAVEVAKEACELTGWKVPDLVDTLAAAHAEAGEFAEAVKWERKALETPEAFGAGLDFVKARLALYEANKPYREPGPPRAPTPDATPPPR